jgi:hypothetical protein
VGSPIRASTRSIQKQPHLRLFLNALKNVIIRIMQPEIIGAQLGLFHTPEYLTGGDISVPELMTTHFGPNINTTTIPIPNDAPAEIPRYEMRVGSLMFKFSNIRADMVSENGDFTDAQIQDFIAVITKFNAVVTRVGYVLNKRYIDVNTAFLESNLNLSTERFGEELNNVSEAMWRINKKKVLGSAGSCNNISILSLEKEDDSVHATLMRDVNTEPESQRLTQTDTTGEIVTLLRTEAAINGNIII